MDVLERENGIRREIEEGKTLEKITELLKDDEKAMRDSCHSYKGKTVEML